MHTLTSKPASVLALGLLATACLGCDIFLPEKGGQDQPCLDNQTCDDGLVCRDGVCRGHCQDSCAVVGQERCALGTQIERCQASAQGCLDWVFQQDCATNDRICKSPEEGRAECAEGCDPEWACTVEGQERCRPGVTVVQACTRLSPTCLQWQDTESCVAPQYCADLGGGDFGCAGGCSVCGPQGALRCDGVFIQRCSDVAGCLVWVADTNCAQYGQTCKLVAGAPTCEGTCTSECMSGETRCAGSWLQGCEPTGPCFLWADQTDCAAAGEVCNQISQSPPQAECSASCTPTCTQGTPLRCETHLLLESCDEVTDFPGCWKWNPAHCNLDENCATCEHGYEVVCNTGLGRCECEIPCGADGQTCCPPGESCADGACLPACVPPGGSCTGGDCCGNAACAGGLCTDCGSGTACGDVCCPPNNYCQLEPAPACKPCDPASEGPACGIACCPLDSICTDRLAGMCETCNEALGEELCATVCCATASGQFCASPGHCDTCPSMGGTECTTADPPRKECCTGPAVCIPDQGCCDPGCEALPCGPAPNGCGGLLCGPAPAGQACTLAAWSVAIGGSGSEAPLLPGPSLVSDGDVVSVLALSESLAGQPLWLGRFLEVGSPLTQRSLEGAMHELSGVLRVAPADGSLIMGATTSSWHPGSSALFNFWLVRFGPDMSIAWQQVWGTEKEEHLFDLQPLPPSAGDGFVAAGDVFVGASQTNAALLLVDGVGAYQKGRQLASNTLNLALHAITPIVANGSVQGYLGVGNAWVGVGPPDIWLVRLDADLGAIAWQRQLGGANRDEAWGVVPEGPNAAYVVGTVEGATPNGWHDVWVAKVSYQGDIVWQHAYGEPGSSEWGHAITRLPDGDLLVAAQTAAGLGATDDDGWLLRLSGTDGRVRWQRRYDAGDNEALSQVVPVNGNLADGFAAVGYRSAGGGPRDLWLLRLDEAAGIVGCAGVSSAFTQARGTSLTLAPTETDAVVIDLDSPATAYYGESAAVHTVLDGTNDLDAVDDCP